MKIQRKLRVKHTEPIKRQFLHNPWTDLSHILDLGYQHIFCIPNKISGKSVHVCSYKRTKHVHACSGIFCACTVMFNALMRMDVHGLS